ncbi:MAG TPA: hypothetical protein VNO32_38435, partial [Candidatus Acidoferrum sp.]|nr:hypothetical protein [Candidatus Acidoferrum sp.]
TPGTKLSYLGYEFETPWSDLDPSKTERYPKDKPDKTAVVLTFRSGLRLRLTAFPNGEWETLFTTDLKLSPQQFEQFVGREGAKSDYVFLKSLYEFTPDKMYYWAWPASTHSHDAMVLMLKSIAPAKAAETGIFNLQNASLRGVPAGQPREHDLINCLSLCIRMTEMSNSRFGRKVTRIRPGSRSPK